MSQVLEEIIKEAPPIVIKMQKEYDMSPTKDEHNDLGIEIVGFLRSLLKDTDYKVKFDVYRYLQPEVVNLFGDFKNGINLEGFIKGLERFGAPKEFVQRKLKEFAGLGVAQGSYAPDVFVVRKEDDYDQFSIPLVVFEIISPNSLQHDLYYKPYFYETIGVQELFICQATRKQGTIIRAYRRIADQYEDIRLEKDGYFSEMILHHIPKFWSL